MDMYVKRERIDYLGSCVNIYGLAVITLGGYWAGHSLSSSPLEKLSRSNSTDLVCLTT